MRASASVWALVSGLPRGERGGRNLMVLQVFIDDSGSEPQSRFFVLGGFIASHEAWAQFSDEWESALQEAPKLEYFKMSEAANLGGQFDKKRGWTEQKRDDRLISLARIIRKHALVRVSASMPHKEFVKHIASLPVSVRTLMSDNPYPLLFIQMILAVSIMGRHHGIFTPCDFIFDEQVGFSNEIVRVWPQFKDLVNKTANGLPGLVGSRPIFRDEMQFKPLQAADLYAWQVRNHITSNEGTLIVPANRVLQALEPIPEIYRAYDESELIRLRDFLLDAKDAYLRKFPKVPLVGLSENPAERKRLRRQGRKGPKPVRPASGGPSE